MARPTVIVAGGGAAGLWCAIALLERGWRGESITVVEPDPKDTDDHTWGYWAIDPLLPRELHFCAARQVVLREGGRELIAPTEPFRYYCLRSSRFYAYAKRRLSEAGVRWVRDSVSGLSRVRGSAGDDAGAVRGWCASGSHLTADYALDSRPPDLSRLDPRHNTTLQHFGGFFVRSQSDCFEVDRVVFMDFVEAGATEVAFFYAVPSGPREAIVELAVLSSSPWDRAAYDERLSVYLAQRYPGVEFEITEREYGVIPMTDAPLWRASAQRVWAIGTRGGWVQPSSGYAFARTAKLAAEVARRLDSPHPRPPVPSTIQQVFNATMLRFVNEHPGRAGEVFFELFVRNGAPRTFRFLDEAADLGETLRVMWNSPRLPFASLAARETLARVGGLRG